MHDLTTEPSGEPVVHTMENLLAENAELRARIRWLSDRLVEQDKHILRMIDRMKAEISRG